MAALAKQRTAPRLVPLYQVFEGQGALQVAGGIGGAAGAQEDVVGVQQRLQEQRVIGAEAGSLLASRDDPHLRLVVLEPLCDELGDLTRHMLAVRLEAGRCLQDGDNDGRWQLRHQPVVDGATGGGRLARSEEDDLAQVHSSPCHFGSAE